mmetsp:Transcript_35357/g.101535  ORF Transcript_35357/g.101535 Transcript_35357/m.101535 type:complete len:501 (-) Transcript_35357:157-1659(-)
MTHGAEVGAEAPPATKKRVDGALSRMSSHWVIGSTSTEAACGGEGRGQVLRVVVGLFMGYGYYNTMRGTLPQQMRHIAKDLDIPLDRVGLPSSMFSAAYGIGKFSTSVLSDFVPCGEFHALGIFLSGLAVASLGLCSELSSLAWLWGLQGLVQAFGWPFLARVVVTELPESSRAKYWGVLSMAGNIGNMLTPYGMVLAAYCGLTWRGAFLGAGCSAAVVSLLVAWLLCGGRQSGTDSRAAPPCGPATPAAPSRSVSSTLATSALAVWSSPVLLVCMACNMLSFGSSKCIKEWGAVYLRSTGLAASDMQTATLFFWAEVGGSCGAFLSGFLSTRLGGRHALTCVLSATLGFTSLGALAWFSYLAMKAGGAGAPLPFFAACLLQALGMAGVSGVRTLAGLHGAELASRSGMVGMANGWMEMVGQVGSVLSGQPLGALAAHVAIGAAANGAGASSKASLMDAPAGGVAILATLTLASVAMALLNASLLPQEARWIARKAGKTD